MTGRPFAHAAPWGKTGERSAVGTADRGVAQAKGQMGKHSNDQTGGRPYQNEDGIQADGPTRATTWMFDLADRLMGQQATPANPFTQANPFAASGGSIVQGGVHTIIGHRLGRTLPRRGWS